MKRKLFHTIGPFLGIVIGVAIVMVLIATKPKPKRKIAPDTRPLVEVMTFSPTEFEAVVSGFGTVHPSETIPIVTEIGGLVVEMGNGIAEGALVEKGALIFKIDDRLIYSEIEHLKAQISSLDAQMAGMRVQHEADNKFLEIEDAVLKLSEKEYTRLLNLAKNKYVSESDMETGEIRFKERRLAVEKRRADISSFKERLAVVKAMKRAAEALLKKQNILLAKTSVKAPYKCRVFDISMQLYQVVQPGAKVMSIFSLSAPTEILVPIESRHMPALFDLDRFERGKPLWTQVRLEAEVTWNHFGRPYRIIGHLARFGAQVDPNTRTLTAIVELPSPEQRVKNDTSRGLLPGTFVKVCIKGRKFENVLVLPEKAFESRNSLHVVKDGKLHNVQVKPLLVIEGKVVLPADGSLLPGKKVVITEISDAFEGTPVRVIQEGSTSE